MARADRFALRIPARYAVSVRWRRRRAGRINAVHPVFLVLGGWTRGPADLDHVAESTGAADLQRERAERYKRDRDSWLRPQAADGWLSLDDDEYDQLSRWPVLGDDFVRGPPGRGAKERPSA